MNIEKFTIIKISATGKTNPYVPFGTEILLIQDGIVQVGKLLQDPDDKDSVYIDHPKNQTELDFRATKAIEEQKPEYLLSDVALIIICPAEISKDMLW